MVAFDTLLLIGLFPLFINMHFRVLILKEFLDEFKHGSDVVVAVPEVCVLHQ